MGALEQTRGADDRIAALADRQYGVVARRQLEAIGVGRRGIEVRLRGGRFHRLHRGVYAVGHRVLSREARWMAAILSCGPNAALSHRSAAALWGIRRPSRGPIEVTSRSKTRSRPAIHRHFSKLPADEMTLCERIPVTTVPRTLFDLAAVEPAHVVEAALRESEYLRLHDALSLFDLLERYPRRKGSKAIRCCLARRREAPGRTRSWLEERFLALLDRHQLPRPHLNAWVEVGGRSAQVDCLWPERRAIVELDGFAAHGTRVAFLEDRARDRRLRVAGYGLVRIGHEQLDDEPEAIAADLRILLRQVEYKRS